jgi:hypothetical protein
MRRTAAMRRKKARLKKGTPFFVIMRSSQRML